ncbi:hypothetical protein ISF_09497 [Cordyceps fumosorosea ARSEF 2679]|uniref:Uncharacterized protein n=1 Tax=Cordyceps fumosorosea (strain ARSEF 2679) TaxID=1081104 RepID=A0A167HIY4_CORFA|nr:hypothetical protein ISF_09497 [Cordyceps fumosorosea ARSEF 2679]OAA47965.1 hypothetical protein ISF_09497 [Cordyceps fumosorosea ARSEF 2679]
MSGPGRPILAPLDEQQLQSQGLASQNSAEGTRKLHRRRMNRSSDSENEQIPLDVSYSAPDSQSAFATIPTFLISRATLIHVGFTKTRASQLWDLWGQQQEAEAELRREFGDDENDGMGMTFLDFMKSAISRSRDTASSRDQDWIAAMTAWGIQSELQEAMTDPMFDPIRHSQSCAYWVKDTIEMRFAALEQTQKTSEERNALLARGRTADLIERQFRADAQIANARSAAARNAPGHTMLYRGMDEGRAMNLVQDWDSCYLNEMLSMPPSDFSPSRRFFYFSPQRFVAQYYASWVTRRNENIEPRPKPIIIQFSMPNSTLESLSSGTEKLSVYFPDDEWKKLIWYSRRDQPLPTTLTKYHNATLIIGTIARGPDLVLQSLRSWEQVSDNNVLKLGPPRNLATAIQFVFTDDKGGLLLQQNMSSFSKQDFDAREYCEWRRGHRIP